MEKENIIIRIWKKLTSREIIIYCIVGGMTSGVNWLTSYLSYNILSLNENVTNLIAWVVAVAFAYIANDRLVFQIGFHGWNKEIGKIWKFTASRIATGLIEIGGGALFVTILKLPYWPVKISISVIVIILNYIFSKLVVFIKDKKQ